MKIIIVKVTGWNLMSFWKQHEFKCMIFRKLTYRTGRAMSCGRVSGSNTVLNIIVNMNSS